MTDREKLIALLKGDLPYHSNEVAYWSDEHIGALADRLLANGVVVREKGEWVYDHWCEFKCSKCGALSKTEPRGEENFCPNCGADMTGGGRTDEA